MPECTNCRAFVSRDFARVFGDNGDVVRGCVECRSTRTLTGGVTSADGDQRDL